MSNQISTQRGTSTNTRDEALTRQSHKHNDIKATRSSRAPLSELSSANFVLRTGLAPVILSYLPTRQLFRMNRLNSSTQNTAYTALGHVTTLWTGRISPSESEARRILQLFTIYARRLRHVNLGSHEFPDQDIARLMNRCPNIETIEGLPASALLVSNIGHITSFPNVTRLHARNLTNETIHTIADKLPNLRCAQFQLLRFLRGVDVDVRLRPILEKCRGMRSLRLDLFVLTERDLPAFENLKKLERLWFYAGSMTDHQCAMLSKYLSQTVTELKLSGLNITWQGIQCFAFTHPNLKRLDISFTSASEEPPNALFRREQGSSAIPFPNLRDLQVRVTLASHLREALKMNGRDGVEINAPNSSFFDSFRASWV